MGSTSVRNNDRQDPSPCDGGRLIHGCAEHLLNCKSYVHWMAYGQYRPPQGLPTRGYYEAAHAEQDEMLAKMNKARGEELKLTNRARMRKIADKFTGQ